MLFVSSFCSVAEISRMGDEEKRLDQGAVPLERITAAPAWYEVNIEQERLRFRKYIFDLKK